MIEKISFRDYVSSDRESCLAVFDSNIPKFFAAEERPEFDSFLDALPGPYLVMLEDDTVIGCGGWAKHRTEPNYAVLCWGMIDARRHLFGLGRRLMEARLSQIRAFPEILGVLLNTSQHSAGFFTRFGFQTRKIVSDGHAPGIDLYEMLLSVKPIH